MVSYTGKCGKCNEAFRASDLEKLEEFFIKHTKENLDHSFGKTAFRITEDFTNIGFISCKNGEIVGRDLWKAQEI